MAEFLVYGSVFKEVEVTISYGVLKQNKNNSDSLMCVTLLN